MALTTCRECSGSVSTQAPFCPHCGADRPARRYGHGLHRRISDRWFWLIVLVALCVPLLFFIDFKDLFHLPARGHATPGFVVVANGPPTTPSPAATHAPHRSPSPSPSEKLNGLRSQEIRKRLIESDGFDKRLTPFIEPQVADLRIPRVLCTRHEIVIAGRAKSANVYLVMIRSRPFLPDLHRISQTGPSSFFFMIDGEPIMGTDGSPPSREVGLFRVAVNGVDVRVPNDATRGLYEPNLCSYEGYQYTWAQESHDGNHLYVYMVASDGAGAYCVKWVFSHHEYLGRIVLGQDECDWLDYV